MAEVTDSKAEAKSIAENPLSDQGIYSELLVRSGGQFTGNQEAINELMPVYKKLHSISLVIGGAYKKIAAQYGLQPGKVEVVLGGGRAKGEPFKEGSDLDIFFHIENPDQNVDSLPITKYPSNPVGAMDEKNIKMQSLQRKVGNICTEQHIPNHFHIMGWGAPIPKEYEQDSQLLLAKVG